MASVPDDPDRCARRFPLAGDNPVNQEVMLAVLESSGLDVHCSADGHEAATAAREGGFDMVPMDRPMPLEDGCTAGATCAQQARAIAAPVLRRSSRSPRA